MKNNRLRRGASVGTRGDTWEYLLTNDFEECLPEKLVPLILPVKEEPPYWWFPEAIKVAKIRYIISNSPEDQVMIEYFIQS